MNHDYNCIVICGPTATGKTKVAVRLADMYKGEIISADSRQVYRQMDIGTGKDLNEYNYNNKKINYHLMNIADPDEVYNLYKYLRDFYTIFYSLITKKIMPVICGGTGLYLEAALKKYKVANVPENSEFRELMMKKNIEELKYDLKKDIELFKATDISSKKRIIRSLEIFEFSKTGTVEYSSTNAPDITPIIFCIKIEKQKLDKQIDKRLNKRFVDGMIEEVSKIIESGISKERMYMFGLEYKWVSKFIFNEITENEMKEKLAVEIHKFAKRQNTWFRGMERRGLEINWINHAETNQMIDQISSKL